MSTLSKVCNFNGAFESDTIILGFFQLFKFCVINDTIDADFFIDLLSNRFFFNNFVDPSKVICHKDKKRKNNYLNRRSYFTQLFEFLFVQIRKPETALFVSCMLFENIPVQFFSNIDYKEFLGFVFPNLICNLSIPEQNSESATFFISHFFNKMCSSTNEFDTYFMNNDGFVIYELLSSTLNKSLRLYNYEVLFKSNNSDFSSPPNLLVLQHLEQIFKVNVELQNGIFEIILRAMREQPNCARKMNNVVEFSNWILEDGIYSGKTLELIILLNETCPSFVKDCLPYLFKKLNSDSIGLDDKSDIIKEQIEKQKEIYINCLKIIYSQQFPLRILIELNFISVFISNINRSVLIYLLQKDLEFSRIIIDLIRIKESISFHKTIFKVFVSIYSEFRTIPNYSKIISLLLIYLVEYNDDNIINEIQAVLNLCIKVPEMINILCISFLKSPNLTKMFIRKEINGLDWLYDNYFKTNNNSLKEYFIKSLFSLMLICGYDEIIYFLFIHYEIFDKYKYTPIKSIVYEERQSIFRPFGNYLFLEFFNKIGFVERKKKIG